MIIFKSTAAGLAVATTLVAGDAVRPPSAREQTSVGVRVDELFKDFTAPGSPGCTVGAYRGGQIVHRGAYGMANLDHDIKLTPASVFHVASVSKQFTATAMLLLVADGKLALDDDVRKFIPELPDFGHRITIRHLAHHTSGIRDQWDLLGLAGWRYSRDLITDDDVLQMLSRQKDVNFTPGARHLYSNSGYTLMATIVRRASGQSFRQFTTERIFKPLGMVNTHFRDNFNEVVKGQAYGYGRDGAGFRLSVTNFDTAGATSLMTTAEDLAKWNAQFDEPVVGGQALLTALLTRGVLNDGRPIDYAFGISHGTYRGVPTVSHGGADAGYRAAFLRFPAQRFGVAVLCNLASANPTLLAQRVADVYLADVLQATPVASASPDKTPEVPISAAELDELAGLYWNSAEAQSLRFVVQEGRLRAALGMPIPFKSLGSGRFVAMTGAAIVADFDLTNGRAARVTVSPPGASSLVLERAEPFTPTAAALAEFAGTYRSDEIEPPYRMTVRDGSLRLERLKAPPAQLGPLVADTFTSPLGIVRFVREGAGRVTGFVLDGGRIRGMKFSRIVTDQAGAADVSVRVETPLGTIVIALDTARAPITTANFLKYVDGGFYTNGRFHRATRPDNYTPAPPDRPAMEIIQGGINPERRGDAFPAIPFERTSVTGLKHVTGVVSMARGTAADTATSDFFILLDDQPSLDFGGKRFADGQGGAAFGRVVEGLDVVRKIQQQPVQGQNLTPPVPIKAIARVK